MNTLQFLAIFLYIALAIIYFYYNTNKFEKGWVKKFFTGKYANSNNSGGLVYLDFRILAVVVVVSLVLLLKWAGVS